MNHQYFRVTKKNAISEIYENIRFQCSICGMRFIRNQILKTHLDTHFRKANEFRRKGNRTISRPFFMSSKDFVAPKSSQGIKGGKGNNNSIYSSSIV
jgi:uncharacterized Zn-finger protein